MSGFTEKGLVDTAGQGEGRGGRAALVQNRAPAGSDAKHREPAGDLAKQLEGRGAGWREAQREGQEIASCYIIFILYIV